MPDGPHRSLPMTPDWKKLLRWAESPANPYEDGAERLERALKSDWHRESLGRMLVELEKIEAATGGCLSPEKAVLLVEDLSKHAVGRPFALSLLDCFVWSLSRSGSDVSTLDAVKSGLTDRVGRSLRQIEEHCLRECTEIRVGKIRRRLDQLANEFDFARIARDLVEGRNGNHRRPLPKKTGLHDGPPLP